MKSQHLFGLLVVLVVSLWSIADANHCGNRATAQPNETDPNHSSSSDSSSESNSKSQQCPDPNQVYSYCASVCPHTCSNWWEPITCQACRPRCTCRDNYVLDKHNRCVPISKCPKPVCKDPRREFTEHGSVCPPACPSVNDGKECTYQFVAGCFCRKGLLEDGNGNCVHPSHCPEPVCKDPNRYYTTCGSACPKSCKNWWDYDQLICTDQCVSGCFCRDDLVEDGNGNCVDPENCPKPECKDPNRYYTSCGTACPKTCKNWWYYDEVSCTEQCVPGCFCRDDLVEDDNGNCVDPNNCPEPECKDPIRYYTSCGTACPKTCKNWWHYDEINCTEQCVPGCFCRDDLVEDGNGNCVDSYECPEPVCKDRNREWSGCGTACPDSCDNINEPSRICTLQCVSDCFCKSPLVEDGKGNCINRTDCPNPTCEDPDQYYTECGSACTKSCTNRCKDISCIQVCVKGCFCQPWLIDDGHGKCINPDDCPANACKCEGNSVWHECGGCDGTCTTPNPPCPKDCNQRCLCPRGWVRDNRNVCIQRKDCPKQ